jgi:uncharacterized protein with GYD domain
MFFISLVKWKHSPTKLKDAVDQFTKTTEELAKKGIKIQTFWTLGRYNGVSIIEAPSEKEAMKLMFPLFDVVDEEMMVAIPREEAIKLL